MLISFPQFQELCGGREGLPAVNLKFYQLLRHIDDFLQLLTLGISSAHPENPAITLAHYRQLPADFGSPEGAGTGKESPFVSLLTASNKNPKQNLISMHTATDPIKVYLQALNLKTFSTRAQVKKKEREECMLFNESVASSVVDTDIVHLAGPACIRSAKQGRVSLRYYWAPNPLLGIMTTLSTMVGEAWPVWLSDANHIPVSGECNRSTTLKF